MNKLEGYEIGNYDRAQIEELRVSYHNGLLNLKEIFDRVKTLRDKFYAHRDDEFYTQIDREVKFSEGLELIELARQILNNIAEISERRIYFISQEETHAKTGICELILLSKNY